MDLLCAGNCGLYLKQKRPDGRYRHKKQKCCSHACAAMYKQQKHFEVVRTSGQCSSVRIARPFLISAYGNRCSVCGLTEWNGKALTMEIDHIDGDGTNHSINNQRLVCPNCHSQTPTYKGRNRGNGRVARRERARDDYHRAK